jgi:hypothetical protein
LTTILSRLKNLTNLVLDFKSTQIKDSVLKIPDNVQTLAINFKNLECEIDLNPIIPKSVTNLTLFNYGKPLSNDIRKQIETLSLTSCHELNATSESCFTALSILVNSQISKIRRTFNTEDPRASSELDNSDNYDKLTTLSFTEYVNTEYNLNIPSHVTTLIFKGYCPLKLSKIPDHINTLHIGKYRKGEDIIFPSTIINLTLGNDIAVLLKKGSIPEGVKKLTFGNDFKQKLKPEIIPDSVDELNLPHNYDHDLKEIFRSGRKINKDYKSYICDLELPDNVKENILRDLHKPIC